MVKNLLQQNKGVSLMIAYVLLIVIGISLSIAVYAYLNLYLPRQKAECNEDVVLSIESSSCFNGLTSSSKNVNITIANRGLFTIDGAFIRIGQKNRIFREVVIEPDDAFDGQALPPGSSWTKTNIELPSQLLSVTNLEVEIQPAVYVGDVPAICEKAVVSTSIVCPTS